MCEDMEGSSSDDESASVFAKPNENENLEEVVAGEGGDDVHHSQTKFRRCEDASMLKEEIVLVSEKKFICSLDLLLNVFLKCCQTPGCCNNPEVSHHFIGATLIVNSSCKAGHHHRFCSSHDVNGIYANNLQLSAAVLLSGNNFGKVDRLAQFMSLAFPSESTYFRMQRLYLLPAIDEWWHWMRCGLIDEFKGKDVIVGGDGQCDSPGFSAKNLCYFLMEVTSGYILEVQIQDKRHVGLASTNMEKQALKIALTRLNESLKVVEIVTDASASIKKLISKLKSIVSLSPSNPFTAEGKFLSRLFNIFDVSSRGDTLAPAV